MRIQPLLGSVVGQTSPTHWGQVLISPHAYGVVEIEDTEGIARQLGVTILSKLSQRLSHTVVSLADVQEVARGIQEENVVTCILCVPVGAVVYIVLGGEGKVFLKRGDQLACLVDHDGAISGHVQEGDTLLFVSRAFVKTLTDEQLGSVFDHLAPAEVAEKLTLLLHGTTDGEGSAGLIFQVKGLTPIEREELFSGEESESVQTVLAQPTTSIHAKGRFLHDAVSQVRHIAADRRLASTKEWFQTVVATHNGKLALVAGISVVLFVSSVILGIRKQAGQQRNQIVSQSLVDAQHSFDEGIALLDLNPVKGRERLTQAQTLLEPLVATVSAKTKEGRQLAALLKQVRENLTQAMQIVRSEPQLFYDVSLLKKGARVSSMALSDDLLGMVDTPGKTVYALTVSSKSAKVVAGGDAFTSATLVAAHGDKVYVLTQSAIHEVRTLDTKTTQSVVKKPVRPEGGDSEWGKISALVSFGGNLYLLDTLKSRIWKYVSTSSGFSEMREYLNPDTLPDLSRATGMAIDGSVFIGTTDGKILRFTQGKDNTFSPQGVTPPLGTNLIVYTSDAVKHVYVLDSQNKRVVVLDKDGIYLSQYVWEGNFTPSNLVVSESLKKILLLIDGKIYSLELK